MISVYNLFLWASRLAPLLPQSVGFFLCDVAGLLFYSFASKRRQVVLCNLKHVLPQHTLYERKAIARRIFQNHFRNYYDLLRVHKLGQARLSSLVSASGVPQAKKLAAANGNRGLIVFSGHLGSFALCPQVCSREDIDFNLLVEPLQPPKLFELITKLREVDPRMHTIAIGGPQLRQVFKALKQSDSALCIAIDRDVTGGGVPLRFGDADALLPIGTAEIALKTGALLAPGHMYRIGDHYHIDLRYERAFVAESTGDKEADLKRIAERMLADVQDLIQERPDQWVVMQPIWSDCDV